MLTTTFLLATLLPLSTGLPQTSSPSPTPSPAIPWSIKLSTLRTYILSQPDQNATKGFWNGPALQQNFPDTSCLQIRFYNWDCFHDIPYKMRGVAKWLDDVNPAGPIDDAYRYYVYGRYVDPDDGWDFYGEARLSFGACGNRGPQSSCGVGWCVDGEGESAGSGGVVVPKGQSPYVDPNDRNNLCPWLKGNGSTGQAV